MPRVARARVPLQTFVSCIWGVCAALLPLCTADAETPVEPVIVFLVRHAEAAQDGSADPGLSERGNERAQALAEMLAPAGVTHLFASEYARTRQTLAPLAERVGLEVRVVSAREPEAQIEALRALPAGTVAIVAGHSNTVPGLVQKLGGQVDNLVDHPRHGPMIDETHFHRMFLVVLQEGEAMQTLELQYGAPSAEASETSR